MKYRYLQFMSVLMAGLLQLAPLARTFMMNLQGLAPSSWAMILRIGVGASALLGFDAVSRASSIAISPANATVGQPYVGTITYSGGHAGSVSSMAFSNVCLGSAVAFVDGLTIVYNGGNTATVTGTPTGAGNFAFTLKVFDQSGCGSGGNSDARSTTLVVGAAGGGAVAPTISAAPQNTCAQVGTDVQLSGGASGNPLPQYQWWRGLTPIAGATNSILDIPNVQLTNGGVYTLTASNSQTAGYSFGSLPKANCYLSVAISGGTNFSTFNFTNYAPAGQSLTMFSYVTNVATATNYFVWTYNYVNVISTANAFPLAANLVTPARSGTYTVTLSSTNSGGAIISGQNYDSYWAFGYPPMLDSSLPASSNAVAGSSIILSVPVSGSLNVYNRSGGAGGYVTNYTDPCVFWYRDGILVSSQLYELGPTTSTTYSNTSVNVSLALNNLSSADAGNYTVVVTNFWGSITSSPVQLSVGGGASAPSITTDLPAAKSLLVGQSSTLSVAATGTAPLAYQWRKNNAALADGGVFSGALTNALTLTGATTNENGNYSVVITNVAGAVTSSVASLLVAAPPQLTLTQSAASLQISGNTLTGLDYVIQATTNLSSPVWVSIFTNNTVSGGAVNYQTNNSSGPMQFYRVMFP